MMPVIYLLAGGAMLLGGAEVLVRGASSLARALKLSALFIGLTVVALGTSLPELAVSVTSSAMGKDGLAIGNVVGSNIANILLILGLSAAIAPVAVNRQIIRFDIPVMLAVSGALAVMACFGKITVLEGLAFLAIFVLYIYTAYRLGAVKPEEALQTTAGESAPGTLKRDLFFLGAGILTLVIGSHVAVRGATMLAAAWGVSEVMIGLTIVAVGTSLPEMATSVVAAIRGQRDIAVGNVIGSNIANILCVLGASAVAGGRQGLGVEQIMLTRDIPVMIATAALCYPLCITGASVSRREGVILLGGYGVYLMYCIETTLYAAAGPGLKLAAMVYAVLVVVFFAAQFALRQKAI